VWIFLLKKSQVLGKICTQKKVSAYNGLKQILCKKKYFRIFENLLSPKITKSPFTTTSRPKKKIIKILAAPWVP
jgi:hypothetical protein